MSELPIKSPQNPAARPLSRLESVKIKAKLLQKAKARLGRPIQLKVAFQILAKIAGFESWREMKQTLQDSEEFVAPFSSAHWNVWYSSYEESKMHLQDHGGYLLPYQKHFFVCDENYIKSLGIAIDDPDLQKVGFNWVEPKDPNAWSSLRVKLRQARLSPV
jgi:hypothetical protein